PDTSSLSLHDALPISIRPLSDVYMNFRDWYMEQLDMYGEFAASQLDTGLISQTLDQIFISLPAYITLISFALALYTVLMLRLILDRKSTRLNSSHVSI